MTIAVHCYLAHFLSWRRLLIMPMLPLMAELASSVCTQAYVHTCAHVHTCTHAHVHTCTHAHVHTCTHARIHAYAYHRPEHPAQDHIFMCISSPMHIHACAYPHAHEHVSSMHKHTSHIHMLQARIRVKIARRAYIETIADRQRRLCYFSKPMLLATLFDMVCAPARMLTCRLATPSWYVCTLHVCSLAGWQHHHG